MHHMLGVHCLIHPNYRGIHRPAKRGMLQGKCPSCWLIYAFANQHRPDAERKLGSHNHFAYLLGDVDIEQGLKKLHVFGTTDAENALSIRCHEHPQRRPFGGNRVKKCRACIILGRLRVLSLESYRLFHALQHGNGNTASDTLFCLEILR